MNGQNKPVLGRKSGFTIIELLIAALVLAVLLGLVFQTFASGMQVKRGEDAKLEVQQNVRAAMQVIAQDLRSSAPQMRFWNLNPCGATEVCSNHNQIAIPVIRGVYTTINSTSGTSTTVSDASGFSVGSDVLYYNNRVQFNQQANGGMGAYQSTTAKPVLLKITAVQTTSPQSVSHAATTLTGTLNTTAYLFLSEMATYSLQNDPVYTGRKILTRRTGMSSSSGLQTVAFDIKELEIDYGVPADPTVSSGQVIFYDTPAEAANALGAAYTADPNAAGTYIGNIVRSIRIKLSGESRNNLPNQNVPATFGLTETVDLR